MKKVLSLGEKVKTARKQVGLSQKELAEKLNISDKTISSYEVNRATPPLQTLREMSKVTYQPMTYFVDDQTEEDGGDLRKRMAMIEQDIREIKALLKKQRSK